MSPFLLEIVSDWNGWLVIVPDHRSPWNVSNCLRTGDWSVAGYAGLESLPDYQNVSTANITRFLTTKSSVRYEYLERSLGAVDDEKGVKWEAGSRVTVAAAKAFPQLYGNVDYGILTPLDHSPVWLRVSAGRSFGDRKEAFANFFSAGTAIIGSITRTLAGTGSTPVFRGSN